MRFSIWGIVIGGLVALFVYAVGTALTSFAREGLIWGIIAVIVWIAIATSGIGSRVTIDR